jgi:hypothetical protein
MSSWWDSVWAAMFPDRGGETYIQRQARLASQTSGIDLSPLRGALVSVPVAGAYLGLFGGDDQPAARPSSTQPVAKTAAPSPKPAATASPAPGAATDEASEVKAALSESSLPADQQAALGGPSLYGVLPQGRVYMGGGARPPRGERAEKWPAEKTVSIQQSLEAVNGWSQKQIARFNELAIAAGYIDKPTSNLDVIEKVWADVATRSAKMFAAGLRVTPWQVLSRYAAGVGAAGAVGGQAKTVTTTTSNVDLTNPEQASSLVNQVLAARLGRDATEGEKKDFLAALNAAEKKTPKKTTTTTTTSADGSSVTSNSTSSGGIDAGAWAQEWSMRHNRDEAGSFQALGTYMPLFFQALEAPI